MVPPRQNKTSFYISISFPKYQTPFLIKLPIPTATFICLFNQLTSRHASMLTCRRYGKRSLCTRGKYLQKEILAIYLVCFSLSKKFGLIYAKLFFYRILTHPPFFDHSSFDICLVERAPVTLPCTRLYA